MNKYPWLDERKAARAAAWKRFEADMQENAIKDATIGMIMFLLSFGVVVAFALVVVALWA